MHSATHGCHIDHNFVPSIFSRARNSSVPSADAVLKVSASTQRGIQSHCQHQLAMPNASLAEGLENVAIKLQLAIPSTYRQRRLPVFHKDEEDKVAPKGCETALLHFLEVVGAGVEFGHIARVCHDIVEDIASGRHWPITIGFFYETVSHLGKSQYNQHQCHDEKEDVALVLPTTFEKYGGFQWQPGCCSSYKV